MKGGRLAQFGLFAALLVLISSTAILIVHGQDTPSAASTAKPNTTPQKDYSDDDGHVLHLIAAR